MRYGPRTPTLLFLLSGIVLQGTTLAGAAADWQSVPRDSLCVTEGAIEKAANNRLSVNVPKMRAYVNRWTSPSAELRFTYLGGTSQESALASGTIRRQLGLKLHAQDPCNLVYAMWRIDPKSEIVVSIKRNPDAHTSAECGNGGYQTIKPAHASPVPRLQSGESHTLRAELKNSELRVFVDNHQVWEGDVGQDAAKLMGPIGIRSDNARFGFDFLARDSQGPHPHYVLACKAGAADSD
jgi:hypothetical protein